MNRLNKTKEKGFITGEASVTMSKAHGTIREIFLTSEECMYVCRTRHDNIRIPSYPMDKFIIKQLNAKNVHQVF